jgi:hypothetical protein
MRVVSKPIQSHRISRAEFLELKQETQQAFCNIKDAIIRLTGKHFVDRFLDDGVSCVRPIFNHIYESPNRKPVYEENVSYSEKNGVAVRETTCGTTIIGSGYCTSARISTTSVAQHDHHRNK